MNLSQLQLKLLPFLESEMNESLLLLQLVLLTMKSKGKHLSFKKRNILTRELNKCNQAFTLTQVDRSCLFKLGTRSSMKAEISPYVLAYFLCHLQLRGIFVSDCHKGVMITNGNYVLCKGK